MCQQVYLATSTPLPLVEWNDVAPGFHIDKAAPEERQMLGRVFGSDYCFYSVGSFMGCSCGLFCDSSFRESEPETYAQRLADSLAFKSYLLAGARQQEVRLFTTNWQLLPEVYSTADLKLSVFNVTVFDLSELPEDVILTVVP